MRPLHTSLAGLLLVLCTQASAVGLNLDAQARGVTPERLKTVQQRAQTGDPASQALLANLYLNGQRVAQSDAQAASWANKSAAQGNADALNLLGTLAVRGVAVKGGGPAAARYFKQAADKGSADALSNLGALYYNGFGVKQDPKRALDLYLKSAKGGSDLGMFNLGIAYAEGRAAPVDGARAYAWASLAAGQGNGEARRLLAVLRPKLSAAQLKTAQGLQGKLLK